MQANCYPPEWLPQSTVWLSWAATEPLCSSLPPASEAILDMAYELAQLVPVSFLINSESEQEFITSRLSQRKIEPHRLRFYIVPHTSEWIRDFGPIFLAGKDGLSVASFDWNCWGYINNYVGETVKEDIEITKKIAKECANQLGLPSIDVPLVSEGGNREFNGDGVMIATASVELQRNPGMTINEIENQFKSTFGIQKIIWLNKGVADDDFVFVGPHAHSGTLLEFNTAATGGHCDEFCRFLNKNTIILTEVIPEERDTPLGKETHLRMEENLAILKSSSATDLDGNQFKIVRIPAPPTMHIEADRNDSIWSWLETIEFEQGNHKVSGDVLLAGHSKVRFVLPASYINFIMCNNTILLPKYGRSEGEEKHTWMSEEINSICLRTDQQALEILQEHCPGYTIKQIPSVVSLNIGGGGMHCTSQQQPAVGGQIKT